MLLCFALLCWLSTQGRVHPNHFGSSLLPLRCKACYVHLEATEGRVQPPYAYFPQHPTGPGPSAGYKTEKAPQLQAHFSAPKGGVSTRAGFLGSGIEEPKTMAAQSWTGRGFVWPGTVRAHVLILARAVQEVSACFMFLSPC